MKKINEDRFISRKRKPPSLTWWMKAIKIDTRRAQNETNTTDLSLWMFIEIFFSSLIDAPIKIAKYFVDVFLSPTE